MLQTFYYEPFSRLTPQLKSEPVSSSTESNWTPQVDIVESAAQYQLFLDMPGIDPQTINLTLEKQVLTVDAERKLREAMEGELVTRSERKAGSFKRQFTLPKDADVDSIQASSKDGVLALSIKRLVEQQTVRKIDIQH
mgnify:CR=1 FL=1